MDQFINKLIRFSVYNRLVVLVLTGLLVAAGWSAFQSLPIDAGPDITNVQVQVNSPVQGLAPEEIERNVTFPIETALNGIAGVEQVRSITRFGLSQVTVVFEDSVDIFRARQLVAERLQGISGGLPEGVHPVLGPITSGLGEVFHYTIEPEVPAKGEARIRQMMEIRALQQWFLKPRLLTVKGVAEVNTIGGYEKQYHVQPNPQKMAQFRLHFSDLSEALQRTNKNAGGGYIQQTGEQFTVQGVGIFKGIEDIRAVPVKSLESFRVVTVGDVATVDLGTELRTGAALVNGHEAVLGTVLMLLGENSRTVSQRVATKVAEIQRDLPKGYKIQTLYDRSELVNATLGTVEHNLITGASLVVIVLLLLVGNVRAAIVTALMIPLSLMFTFVVMKWRGISGNLMSLGALDFGIIVDGAVIVLDNCVRVIHERTKKTGKSLTRAEVQNAVYDAAVEIRTAAGFGELIIVVVFLPIFALTGVEGKMFVPMASTFSIAVLGALVLSFTTAPALASLMLSGKAVDSEPWLMRQISRFYEPVLGAALKRRKRTLITGTVLALLGLVLFTRLGGEFLPQLDEGSLTVQFVRPVNVSLDQSIALQEKSEELLKEFPEIDNVFSRIGTAEVATDPMGVNLADTYITLKPIKTWPKGSNGRARTRAELRQDILTRLEEEIPGQSALLSQPIQMRFNELLEGTRADISVKIFGDDMDKLVALAKDITGVISKVPGAGDVEAEIKGTSPILRVKPKTSVLKQFGASSAEVLETISMALGGQEVGYFYEEGRKSPIVIRLDERLRSDLNALQSLPVGIGSNLTMSIKEVADVGFAEAYSAVNREQSKRRVAVLINPRGRDTESFVAEAQSAVARSVKLPPGYFLEWGGNFQNLQVAKARLLVLAPLALVLVLMMIFAAFQSIPQTILIFSGVPLALVGGVLGLVLNRLPFSISAGVGFIALSGIAVLNGVVLVSYFNDLRHRGLSGEEAARRGAAIRLRPVLMTALVDIFGFLPMMLSHGVGAEVQKPLASVVVGGIISSTALTLVLLPVIYCIFAKQLKPSASAKSLSH